MNLSRKTATILAIILSAVFVGGVLAGYFWASTTIPVQVKEPLELTSYPQLIELYAGENQTFQIEITDLATASYTVTLTFTLNDTNYQTSYVTFSDTAYTVAPGLNTIDAWIQVSADAPAPTALELTIDFSRAALTP